MLEIHTVGAGGGSLARFDAGGALRVGPESAGSDPGPICYGRGMSRLSPTRIYSWGDCVLTFSWVANSRSTVERTRRITRSG